MIRLQLKINGIVQGVGFRPFVYREAIARKLTGFVKNTAEGVVAEVQGEDNLVDEFAGAVRKSPPPFSQIHSFETKLVDIIQEAGFKIIKSEEGQRAGTFVSPDIAICSDCLDDINDKSNRRHNYPFTNCTNCGPRYTIIEGVPYDRPKTSMKNFKMCSPCNSEYESPLDRRFHAQPNACPKCGPMLRLTNAKKEVLFSGTDALDGAKKLLISGNIIAIKGLGGFHLACDAASDEVVMELRRRKVRDEKPFAVMMKDVGVVREYCALSEGENKILTSPQSPIVLLRKKKDGKFLSKFVAPNNSYLGVMLPYTPLHCLLFNNYESQILVMTSGNISDEPICFDNEDAFGRLKDIADYFLVHNRDIYMRTDDSITRVVDDKPLMLRRARGYVPQPIIIKTGNGQRATGNDILAVGAGLKNTVCLLKGNNAFISQHIGDLENEQSYKSFEMTIDHLRNLFDINHKIIAHDMHPEYFSTKWALSRKTKDERRMTIQHHHAHIASCMAENQLPNKKVLGVALDGTGFGTDGTIWGGEILLANYQDFERVAHFEKVKMPGGDAAIKNPWQMAVSYLMNAGCRLDEVKEIFSNIPYKNIELVLQMINKDVNSPLTSSCGRLFDAVAAMLLSRFNVSFEGQAALELEMLATDCNETASYPFDIIDEKGVLALSHKNIIKGIVNDIQAGVSSTLVASKFHNTIVRMISDSLVQLRNKYNINDVVLSGGCFQNVILSSLLKKLLEENNFDVYMHSLVPPNDGGISLGQAVIAKTCNS